MEQRLQARDLSEGGLLALAGGLLSFPGSLLGLAFGLRLRNGLVQPALDGALHAQRLLTGLIAMVVALLPGETDQETHGRPHDRVLHPVWKMLGIALVPLLETF
jgi:hypothetical protein